MAIGLSILISGCSASEKNENGACVATKDGDEWRVALYDGTSGEWYFKYAEIDGHEYLIMIGTHRSGLTHSPKCPCLMNNW